ncbi:NUDIX domain-containing protein [Pseudonocardia sp. KRD291]|uniref:NUDIX domain-containing protein n=1 Tax=Pseudonocardia sp. KRD291 TaxID=2792007 RepID=UPI001C4A2AC5|nr:NUDIX domain-containing protein [Pseudonocardia sp. KRD291]MBW0104718.1 NUDIX domain-containing protein [Pseudonocardia sp. KRD291]
MTSRFRVVPASYVLLLRDPGRPEPGGDTEVLLQLRRGTGYRDGHWAAAAAGHVELGESAVAAAVREAAEELGVTIEATDLVPLTAMHRTHGNGDPVDERVDFFFTCRRWAGEPRRMEATKSAEIGWFALDALPDPVVPHERAVLEALRTGGPPAVTTHGFDTHGPDTHGPDTHGPGQGTAANLGE